MSDNQKSRDELVKEMQDDLKKGNVEIMNEIAVPGTVQPVKEQK